MSVKVSVVIPVYNPGRYIEDCIESLLRQSLPDDEYEAIFVNDGSTDETPARLDQLAAEHEHVQVIHQEPSGWSGKPRNVGIAAARGEFVMFVDNDDWLGDEALERMYEYGVANEADVIIGKMAGKGRPVPLQLFRVNRPRANVDNAPLIDSLTPHKMFRKDFLDKHAIRFKEGRRRLEDHVFVAETYLLASSVAVLSDYVCYYHVKREDASNAGFQRFDPVGYFTNLREALDVVERNTQPGPLRDKLYRRWLRNEMVERLRGTRLTTLPDDYRKELFDEISAVVNERMTSPAIAAGMQPTQQIVAALVAAGKFAETEELARWEGEIRPTGRLEEMSWDGGRLNLRVTAEYEVAHAPITFRTEDGEDQLNLPFDAATLEAVRAAGASTRATVDQADASIVVRERTTAAEFYLPAELVRERVPAPDGADDTHFRLLLRATSYLDPETAAGGSPLGPGIWDFYVRVNACGWGKTARLGSLRAGSVDKARRGALSGTPARLVLPYWTDPYNNLSLDVDHATNRFNADVRALTPDGVTLKTERGSAARLSFPLPLRVTGDTDATLRFKAPARSDDVQVPAVLAPAGEGAVLTAELPATLLAGRDWEIELGLPSAKRGAPRFTLLPVGLRVAKHGRATALPAAQLAGTGRKRATARSLPRRVLGRIRRALVRS